MVHQPPGAAWPQASPRLTPWVPYVSNEQSLCGCFGASASHPHPWYHLLFPSVNDEESLLAVVVLYLHIHDKLSLCIVTPKICLLSQYIKNIKKLNNSKLKSGFGILYLCRHKLLLVVEAYLGLRRILSLHRGSRLWRRSISATMERSLLGRG